jgi:hypothetical protein
MAWAEMQLPEIVVDESVNVRGALDEATIEHNREVLDNCPPVVVFTTDEGPLLAHAFVAYQEAE